MLIVSIQSTAFLNRDFSGLFFRIFQVNNTHRNVYERIFYTRKYRLSGRVPEDEYIFDDGGGGFILYSLQRLARVNKK